MSISRDTLLSFINNLNAMTDLLQKRAMIERHYSSPENFQEICKSFNINIEYEYEYDDDKRAELINYFNNLIQYTKKASSGLLKSMLTHEKGIYNLISFANECAKYDLEVSAYVHFRGHAGIVCQLFDKRNNEVINTYGTPNYKKLFCSLSHAKSEEAMPILDYVRSLVRNKLKRIFEMFISKYNDDNDHNFAQCVRNNTQELLGKSISSYDFIELYKNHDLEIKKIGSTDEYQLIDEQNKQSDKTIPAQSIVGKKRPLNDTNTDLNTDEAHKRKKYKISSDTNKPSPYIQMNKFKQENNQKTDGSIPCSNHSTLKRKT